MAVVLTLLGCGETARPPPPGLDAGSDLGACPGPACACAAPLTSCGGVCVDLRTDPASCGACGAACDDGTPCRGGRCACDPGLDLCGSTTGVETCADLRADPEHCGSCEGRCPAGASCEGGVCACAAGRTACPATDGREVCVDPDTSVLHCGRCGNRCETTFDCIGGACRCDPTQTPCTEPGGVTRCAELLSDARHCGACGSACADGEICLDGRCVDACPVGVGCTSADDCRGAPAAYPERAGTFCIPESRETVAVGSVTWTETRFAGGYCLDGYGAASTLDACDPGDPASCDPCSRCVEVGSDPTLGPVHACMRRCDPGLGDWRSTRGGCRPGYRCDLGSQLCLPGCSADAQCRASVVDTDGDGVRDPGETVLDPTSSARCDVASSRCLDLPSDPAAHFGDPCAADRDCPADGFCIQAWAGGYCSRIACGLPGRECGPDGTCLVPFGTAAYGTCLDACVVGDETAPEQILGPSGGDPDCRAAGFRCYSIDGSRTGGCLPGTYTTVTEPNVGAPCESDADCWSPYGNGSCFAAFGQSFCTVTQCGVAAFSTSPGLSSICPEGTVCEGDPAFYTFCVPTCDPTAVDPGCREGFVCAVMRDPPARVCFPACRGDADCRPGDRCVGGSCHG